MSKEITPISKVDLRKLRLREEIINSVWELSKMNVIKNITPERKLAFIICDRLLS